MKKILIILLCLVSLRVSALQPSDTAKWLMPDTIHAASLVLPAALITYGSLSFAVHPIRRLDYYVDGQLKPGIKNSPATYLVFVPIVAVYALNLAGVQGKHDFVDRTALITLSAGFAAITDFSLKHLVHRHAPGTMDGASFPSGHTMGAFAAAEFMAQEYGDQSPVYTIGGYTVAVATGFLRLETHNHWFSEVAAGAGFGILSTKLAYLVYPSIRKWMMHGENDTDEKNPAKKGRFRNTQFVPSFQDGSMGLAFSTNF